MRRTRRMMLFFLGTCLTAFAHGGAPLELAPGAEELLPLPACAAGETHAVNVAIVDAGFDAAERIEATVRLPGLAPVSKTLHAGDPSFYLPYRAAASGTPDLKITRKSGASTAVLQVVVDHALLGRVEDAPRFEAEPNDTPQTANVMRIGTVVEGSADDVEYLDNENEGRSGLDWFRLDLDWDAPRLVIFELDIPDRDVSVNMRVYTLDAAGTTQPYLEGKDPMEIVHDRERERYSKAITRVFPRGTYYLEVNANHPRYQLRSYDYPVPPYRDPALAVEVGLRYVMDVGDAWFAQIPREGNIYRRVQNMHETAMRCTACHPSVFSTEPNLVAARNGYAIPSKTNFRYVVERIYNSITPFYGPDDLYWQRFIAIPLQSQGKQGGILMDFEREISGRETKIVERFGPLLRAAWLHRNELPKDEENGVLPKDSKFGFAWRDWRVLKEVARRTGDRSYALAADNIERIFTSPEAEARIETLQDKMHLVLGLHYMDAVKHAARIAPKVEELFSLQGTDGGWQEDGEREKPSAVYTTGQMLHTLMEVGRRPENDPRMQRALGWLLSKQQAFGGWFQTDSHENFKTPMRESRYALMALAAAYPKPGGPKRGLGTLNEGPAVLPHADAPAATAIEALENIIDAPPALAAGLAGAAAAFLERPEPPVRAAACGLIGRIGGAESVEVLRPLLRDPSKPVWREAAWAMRQLGNRGFAADTLLALLQSEDGLYRRAAARSFAYQFQEMDGRMDIARTFKTLLDDSDLLTRLQALRTLRQWWYRSDDPGFRREVIDTVIARMAVPDVPAMRTNLAQNMYILLDENHQGGVSMERNLRDVPPEMAERTYQARFDIERDILLGPVLRALGSGNALQREALLASFDGSFFKGRYYAQIPRAMIDVGNDREFSFRYMPEQPLLAATLGQHIVAGLPASQLQQAIQLATFFEMPGAPQPPRFQRALLDAQFDDDAGVRGAARDAVREYLKIDFGDSEELILRVAELLHGPDAPARAGVVAAIARSESARQEPVIRAAVHALAARSLSDSADDTSLLPLVNTDLLDDDLALAVLQSAWRGMKGKAAAAKSPIIAALANRASFFAALAEGGAPEGAGQRLGRTAKLLERAATDPEIAVREQVFEALPALHGLHRDERASGILYAGLSDESPAIRSKALALARENEAVWQEEDVHEYVLKLLIDADPKIRVAALETVRERTLAREHPAYLARLKGVAEGDAALREAALAAIVEAGGDAGTVLADARIAELRQPDILFFRDHVNPWFYRKAADQHACVDCHATHTILGLAERPDEGMELSDEAIAANYRSVMKVVNTSDPEQSLVLRKPRSPFGTGVAAADSPTGITHVGGTRWTDGVNNEMYQVLLAFIRSARTAPPPLGRTAQADSFSPAYPPAQAVDGNPATLWHTEYVGAEPGYPHELVLALEEAVEIAGVTVLPRQDSEHGRVRSFELYTSLDGIDWGRAQAAGTWKNDPLEKWVFFPRQRVRFVKLRGLSEVNGKNIMAVSEFAVIPAAPEQVAKSN